MEISDARSKIQKRDGGACHIGEPTQDMIQRIESDAFAFSSLPSIVMPMCVDTRAFTFVNHFHRFHRNAKRCGISLIVRMYRLDAVKNYRNAL
jgi:hypothetical protein